MNKINKGKWGMFRAIFSAAIASLVFAANAFAVALVQEVKGEVRAAVGPAAPAALEKGQRILAGTNLTTGPNSQLIVVFDDGQQLVLNENTQFTVTEYRFQKDDPKSDRVVFNLLRGAARIVTGALVQRSRTAFAMSSPTATIGIRGTDFMVAIVDQPSYLSVLEGEIAATNTAGTATFGAGTFAAIPAVTVLAVAIPAALLPAAAAAAFSSLGAAAVGAAAAAAGAGVGTGVAVAGAVAAAGVVAAAASKSDTPAATTTSGFAGPWSGTGTASVSGTVAGSPISGTCSGTLSGTVATTGLFTGTVGGPTCTTGILTGIVPPIFTSIPIVIDFSAAGGAISAPPPSPVTASGLTLSCGSFSGTASLTPSKTASFSVSCSISGTLTPCTGSCGVSLNLSISVNAQSP